MSEKTVEVARAEAAIDHLAYTTERTVSLAERGVSTLLAGVSAAIEGILDFLVRIDCPSFSAHKDGTCVKTIVRFDHRV